jgi:hypothetical protein
MSRSTRSLLLAVSLTALTSTATLACPAGEALPDGTFAIDPAKIELGSQLAQVRGHLRVAEALAELGDPDGALIHGTHPVAELLELLTDGLEAAGVDPAELATAIEGAGHAFHATDDVAGIEAALVAARDASSGATDELGGVIATDPRWRGSVIAHLVSVMAAEYAASTVDGTFVNIPEYQDAYGFLNEAKALYAEIAPDVSASPIDARTIDEAFAALDAALPTVEPGAVSETPDEVALLAEDIGRALRLSVDASVVAQVDPAAEVAEIEAILEQVLAASAAGDRAGAAELALRGYLEHYELIEGDVLSAAPGLNAELEPLLSGELRTAIQDGTHDEVVALIERARELLPQALEAIGEG